MRGPRKRSLLRALLPVTPPPSSLCRSTCRFVSVPSLSRVNRHSLRALWAEEDDFWDIQMQHDCGRAIGLLPGCVFSSDLGQLDAAHAVLFSAQIFPGSGTRMALLRSAWRLLLHPRMHATLARLRKRALHKRMRA